MAENNIISYAGKRKKVPSRVVSDNAKTEHFFSENCVRRNRAGHFIFADEINQNFIRMYLTADTWNVPNITKF